MDAKSSIDIILLTSVWLSVSMVCSFSLITTIACMFLASKKLLSLLIYCAACCVITDSTSTGLEYCEASKTVLKG